MNGQFSLESGALYWRGKDKRKLLIHASVLGAACVGRGDIYYVYKSAETGRSARPLTAARGSIEKGQLRTTVCEELGRGGRYLYIRDEPRNLALVLESGKLLPVPLGTISLLEEDGLELVAYSTVDEREMLAVSKGDTLWLWQPGSGGFQSCGDWGAPAKSVGMDRMKMSPSGRWLVRYYYLQSPYGKEQNFSQRAEGTESLHSPSSWFLHFYNVESRKMVQNPVIFDIDITIAQWHDDEDVLAVNTVTGDGDEAVYKGVYIDPNMLP